ncbi:hypothetical protein B0T16DRAFT_319518 [Cercophora newfieldiana]|uniref:Hypersensitive response-inducing protein n=1 Tax=Cercophora newfieldiana TaxID=92897 RepID=A0AA40D020_9PEZI|nr:hypothetical protein B0T16DRAFT_319518 [Cercophora newfieldiana]
MKLSILTLAAASAAVINARADVVFEARNFTASCVPHSAMCFYSLNAFQPGTMDTQGYNCTASGVGGPGTLPEIKGGTCLPSSRTFDVLRNETGMTVIVSVQVSRLSYTRGAHFIPSEQIKVIPGVTPTGDYTSYVGPKDFPLYGIWY